jgi:ribokinase/non-canonical purine NTP pyrophosphatase (RdgB/HAM1 family)
MTSRSATANAAAGETGRRNSRIVVIGSANYDLTSYATKLPALGETILGSRFEMSCGGKGANQAVAAAKLGIADTVSMVCKVGSDVFGRELLDNFRASGVRVNERNAVLVGSVPNDGAASATSLHTPTGVASIVVETTSGDNCIIVSPGANSCLTPEAVKSALLETLKEEDHHETSRTMITMVQLEIPYESALQALRTSKQMGAFTILNPAPAPKDGSLLEEFYAYTDILIPNESELRALAREGKSDDEVDVDERAMAARLLRQGIGKAVVVTLGARGAMVVSRGDNDDDEEPGVAMVRAPDDLPCHNVPVVDTVGAGDAFCGALASYLSAGVDLVDAARRACGVAGISVRRRGASYPTYDELPGSLRLDHSDSSTNPPQQPSSPPLGPPKPRITFVTGNPNKLKEVQQILSVPSIPGEGKRNSQPLPFDIVNEALDLPELQGGDPIEIARNKCALAAQQIQGACLTEDTSLCFNALNGMPGPYIKWFLEACGHAGLNGMLAGFEDKSAFAQTLVAFTAGPGCEVHVFEGRTDGVIVPPQGPLDFGWDPIFQPLELGGHRTYAEMSKDEKNCISHRGRSLAKLRDFLLENADEIRTNIATA